ncbi:ATP-binding cassette domain-containing protein [Catenulispora acidiphila]|uniref:ATP-binding cassette domain-containing protein n=1 Tax=Catenulispora acidiphila TaxID=304895 RepID=UPI00117E6655|nr:ATP-binding cassette domain-containing protein [Catenulispora acidiphila]
MEAHRARLEDDLARRAAVARARVTRLREHCSQRLSAYRRTLLRYHPETGWASVVIDAVPPDLPGWLPPASPAPSRAVRRPVAGARTASRRPGALRDVAVMDLAALPGSALTFGSAASGPGLLADPAVPGRFFALHWQGDAGYVLHVLEKADIGPYVEGRAVTSRTLPLRPGATIGLAGTSLQLLPDGRVERVTDKGRLVVGDLNHVRRDGKSLLTNVSFAQPGGTVTAVIGPSGAGKTSLFSAILGELGETAKGSIVFDDRPVIGRTEEIRHLMGFVPQSEDFHPALTVDQALTFADRLRNSSPGARASRAGRVLGICERLHLEERQHKRIQTLSGGERKRLSIALELIKHPRLIMLDEPTSGLDTGLDGEVMEILADVAGTGCTVAVTTHAVEHLDAADNVLVVGPEGRVVFFGPPADVLGTLGFEEEGYSGLMNWLRTGDLAMAASAYADSPAAKEARDEARHAMAQQNRHIRAGGPGSGPLGGGNAETRGRGSALDRLGAGVSRLIRDAGQRAALPRGRNLWAETAVLVHRQASLLLARGRTELDARLTERFKALLQLLAPFLIAGAGAVLAALAAGKGGLRSYSASGGSPTAALSFLVTVCVLTGQALTYSDIVSEVGVIRRECRTGCRPVSVILAKWLVFSLMAAVQAALVTLVFVLWRGAPVSSVAVGGTADLFIGLAAMAVAAVSVGLLVSARAARLEQAVGLATGVALIQVALNGVTIGLKGPTNWIGYIAPSRWGMAALASSTNLNSLARPPAGTAAQMSGHSDRMWAHTQGHWLVGLTMLGLFSVLCVILAVLALKVRLRKSER